MIRRAKSILALAICALTSDANAQTYTGLTWGIDRTATPNEIAVNSTDGSQWFKLIKLTSDGVPTPYFANTFCGASQWITAASGVPVCAQPSLTDINSNAYWNRTVSGDGAASLPGLRIISDKKLVTDTSTDASYGEFISYYKPSKTTAGNWISSALFSRLADSTGGGTIFNEWRVMMTPLNPASGLPGAPTNPQLFSALMGEWNPQNRHADTGYANNRRVFNNWTGGWQMVPETQDFTALLGGARIGYHTLFGFIFGGSALTATDTGLTAKTYNAILTEPNALAPLGRFLRLFGTRDFAKAVSSVAAGGSGYAVGNVLTVQGGTVLTSFPAAQIEVTAVDGSGAITGARIRSPGFYTSPPASPASGAGGAGSGATFNLTWSGAGDNPEAILEASEAWNKGINLTGATFANYAIASTGFSVDGGGLLTASLLNTPHRATPGSPANGWIWTETGGMFVRINGATKTVADLQSAQSVTGAKTFSAGALIGTDFLSGANKVVGARATGWGAPTGTLDRTALTTYAGQTASAGYVQAEAQATDNACKKVSQELGALITDLRAHGLIGN